METLADNPFNNNLSDFLGSSQHSQSSQLHTPPNPAAQVPQHRSTPSAAAGSAAQAAAQAAEQTASATEELIVVAEVHRDSEEEEEE